MTQPCVMQDWKGYIWSSCARHHCVLPPRLQLCTRARVFFVTCLLSTHKTSLARQSLCLVWPGWRFLLALRSPTLNGRARVRWCCCFTRQAHVLPGTCNVFCTKHPTVGWPLVGREHTTSPASLPWQFPDAAFDAPHRTQRAVASHPCPSLIS